MTRAAMLLASALPAALAPSACNGEIAPASWGYSGPGAPDKWASLSDAYRACGEGTAQSPVDIAGYAPRDDAPPVAFHYPGAAAAARNNGHTVYLDYEPANSISIGVHSYTLLGIHFHAPSEHTLDGESFAAELHLVHQDASANLAVVGLLFRSGAPSPAVSALLAAAPEAGDAVNPEPGINAADFVPTMLGYYAYDGSLTTPPCTEGVRWVVMREIGTVSPEQAARMQELTGGPNNRPIQPIGGRSIIVAGAP